MMPEDGWTRFQGQRVAEEARKLLRLGMTFRAIGEALRVDEKQIRRALVAGASRGARGVP